MKKHYILLTVLSFVFLLFGCSEEKTKSDVEVVTHVKTDSTKNTNAITLTFNDLNGQFYINGITLGTSMDEVVKQIGTTPYDDILDESQSSDVIHRYEELGLEIFYLDDYAQYIHLTISREDFESIVESNIAAQKYVSESGDDTYLYFHSSPKQLLKVNSNSQDDAELSIYILAPDHNFNMTNWKPVSATNQSLLFEDLNGEFYFNGITIGMTMDEVMNEIGAIPYHEEIDESGYSDVIHVYEDLGLHIGYNGDYVRLIYLTISRGDFKSIVESNISAQKHQTSYDSEHYFYFHPSPKQLLKVGDYPSEPELIVYILVPDSNFEIADWIPVN